MRLFRSKEHPEHLIGEDRAGALLLFPAAPRGWTRRTPYTGGKRQLEEVSPVEGRGTGWPGAIGGKPRSTSGASVHSISVRVTTEERDLWESAAGERRLSDWIRETLTATARRSKGKP